MQTRYIVFEAACMCCDKCRANRCLSNKCIVNEGEISVCENLLLGTARSAIVLTDKDGIVINANEFWGGFDISNDKYDEKETKWLLECSNIIDAL